MTMSLEAFRATRRETTMAETNISGNINNEDHLRKAWVYADTEYNEAGLVIESLQDGTPWLLIENREWAGTLEDLEVILYDYYTATHNARFA